MTDTLRGAAFMTLAMLGFAIEDALIKSLGGVFSAPQIIWMLGLGGAACLGVWLRARGEPVWTAQTFDRGALLRSACEVVGTCFFVSALVVIPLSTASIVIQATPLVVALGAVLFLGAQIGWRRWAAIGAGFVGVLMILRPGSAEFDPAVLLAVGGMLGLAARDLTTRGLPPALSGVRLSLLAFTALVPAGVVLQAVQGAAFVAPGPDEALRLMGCVALGILAYIAIVAATRTGDLALVSSFRYTRLLFALVIAGVFFGERPDGWTLAGAGVILSAGIYTLLREAGQARSARRAAIRQQAAPKAPSP